MAWPGNNMEQMWHDTHSTEQTWHETLHGADMARPGNNMEQIWHDTLYRADLAQDPLWSRYGTRHSMEQIWHGQGTIWSRFGTTHTLQSRPGRRHSMEQIWHDQGTICSRFSRQASSRSFSCDIPRLLWDTLSHQQIPRKSMEQQELPIDRALYFTCLSLVTLHVIESTVSVNYKRFLSPQPTQRLLE